MNKRGSHGFTLIELLISAVVLAAIAASFSFLFRSAIKQSAGSYEFLAALNEAQSQMEEMRSVNFSETAPKAFGGGRGRIIVRPVSHDLLEIQLILNWKEGKNPIEFYTMRSKY